MCVGWAQALLVALPWSVTMLSGAALPAPTMPASWSGTPAQSRKPAPPVAATPSAPIAGTATLSGTVVSSVDRVPLARARLVLTSPALPVPRVTISDGDGHYTFAHLPASSYVVGALRSGYAPMEYGERGSGPATRVVLDAGQIRTGVDFALAPAGVIAGVILDEDGHPFSGATVEALVRRAEAGQATLVTVATAQSDDQGAFRLAGIAAGQYYVSALDPVFAVVGDETGPLHYPPTFYPGVMLIEEAMRINVAPGEPAPAITITLKIVRPSRVSGIMTPLDRRQLLSGAVVMTPLRSEAALAMATRDVTILPDGTFVFRDVPPGRYQIRGRGEVDPAGVALFASYRVVVDGRDINDIRMSLLPGATISGSVAVEPGLAAKPPSLSGVRVRAPFADGSSFGDALTGEVQPKGSYSIRGVMSGGHIVTVEGLRYPWVMKRVTYRGQDISDSGIEADSRQRFDDVLVTITDQASDISGVVRNADGASVANAVVLIIPLSQQFWTRTSRRLGVLRTDAEGRYRLRGLPPGEYRAVASQELDESEAYRAALLQNVCDTGLPLDLSNLEQRVLDLPLTSMAALQRASSR